MKGRSNCFTVHNVVPQSCVFNTLYFVSHLSHLNNLGPTVDPGAPDKSMYGCAKVLMAQPVSLCAFILMCRCAVVTFVRLIFVDDTDFRTVVQMLSIFRFLQVLSAAGNRKWNINADHSCCGLVASSSCCCPL